MLQVKVIQVKLCYIKSLHWQNTVSCPGLKGTVVLIVDNPSLSNSEGTGKGTLTGVKGIGEKT